MVQMKEQDKTLEKDLKGHSKLTVIKIFTEFCRKMSEHSENLNKEKI